MVKHLVEANEKLLTDLRTAKDVAADSDDSETEDLMIARTQVHKKSDLDVAQFFREQKKALINAATGITSKSPPSATASPDWHALEPASTWRSQSV